jgi:hypothetical protein
MNSNQIIIEEESRKHVEDEVFVMFPQKQFDLESAREKDGSFMPHGYET